MSIHIYSINNMFKINVNMYKVCILCYYWIRAAWRQDPNTEVSCCSGNNLLPVTTFAISPASCALIGLGFIYCVLIGGVPAWVLSTSQSYSIGFDTPSQSQQGGGVWRKTVVIPKRTPRLFISGCNGAEWGSWIYTSCAGDMKMNFKGCYGKTSCSSFSAFWFFTFNGNRQTQNPEIKTLPEG